MAGHVVHREEQPPTKWLTYPCDDVDPTLARIVAATAASYIAVRVLEDGSVAALGRLLYTLAVFLRCSVEGWEIRFSFDKQIDAVCFFAALKTADDEPERFKGSVSRYP